jgi:hypothetical protein
LNEAYPAGRRNTGLFVVYDGGGFARALRFSPDPQQETDTNRARTNAAPQAQPPFLMVPYDPVAILEDPPP